MIGAGGFARANWINRVFPDFKDEIEIVALVDINEDVLADSGKVLQLPDERLFTRMEGAFEKVEADFCAVVIPPWAHKDAVLLAAERGVHIISEKPIADTLDACREIYEAVKKSGVKTAVIQNYRFTARMLTFRKVLREGKLGRLNYLIGRFAADYRKYGSWGAPFRHEMEDALIIEGAVHHFDMLRNLAGADCETICGFGWNPEWSSFKGDCVGLFVMEMTNGSHAFYEGNCCGAGRQNSWHKEYYRAEFEGGAVELDADDVVRIIRRGEEPEAVPMVAADKTGHHTILRDFLKWLDGGSPPETCIDDNIKSAAMMFAAIDAARNRTAVRVADYF